VVTEEDGVDKAGRATDPSLMVAPSGRDIDPDEGTVEATAENEVMSSSRSSVDTGKVNLGGDHGTDVDANGHASASHPSVPLPADQIGRPKTSSADPSDAPDASEAPDSPDNSDQPASAAPVPNGKLEGGRSTVRQAMAATNSWFAARTAKSDSAEEPASAASSAGSDTTDSTPAYRPSSRETTTGSTASPSTTSSPGAAATAAAAAAAAAASTSASTSGTGRSLWRDAYTSSQSASSPESSGSAGSSGSSGSSGSAQPSGTYSGSSYAPSTTVSSDTPGGSSNFSSGATSAGGGSAAGLSGYASAVTAAWQNRSSGASTATKRKRESSVRRSTRRQAQLTLARVEPWSVMKFSFVASVVAFIILFVAVAVLYMVLSALGVFDSLQHTVTTITSSQGSSGTNISHWFSASRILGYTGMLGALNIVLITAMSTIGAVVYNLIARTIGGVEVTLRETD